MLPRTSPEDNGTPDDFPPPGQSAVAPPTRSAPSSPFTFLGEPFTSYATLLSAADAAKQRLWRAQVAGEPNAVREAELGYAAACAAVESFKHHGACVFLAFARFAAEKFPGALQASLDPVFRRELSHTQDAVRDCEERVEELQDAVVRLEVGEGIPA